MKKFLSILLSTMLLISCFSLTALADASITLSEDYQTLTYDGDTYTRVNATGINIDYYEDIHTPVALSEAQKQTIQKVYLQSNENEIVLYAEITFTDGAHMDISYLQTDYLEEYQKALNGQADTFLVDFVFPEGNVVEANSFDLYVNDTTLKPYDFESSNYYNVCVESKDKELSVISGAMFHIDDAYFYVSFAENGVTDYAEFTPYEYAELKAHKLSNEELISKLDDAQTSYYADDFGFLLNDDLSETIASVFLIFTFGFLPFALFVLFLILAIRSKTTYKKLFRMIYCISASVLVVALSVAALIFL